MNRNQYRPNVFRFFFRLFTSFHLILLKSGNEANESKKTENEFTPNTHTRLVLRILDFVMCTLNYYYFCIIFGRQIPQIWNPMPRIQKRVIFGAEK